MNLYHVLCILFQDCFTWIPETGQLVAWRRDESESFKIDKIEVWGDRIWILGTHQEITHFEKYWIPHLEEFAEFVFNKNIDNDEFEKLKDIIGKTVCKHTLK